MSCLQPMACRLLYLGRAREQALLYIFLIFRNIKKYIEKNPHFSVAYAEEILLI